MYHLVGLQVLDRFGELECIVPASVGRRVGDIFYQNADFAGFRAKTFQLTKGVVVNFGALVKQQT